MTSVDVHDVANSGEPIGLLAGWGRLPIQVARTLKHEGHRVFCLGIKDHADAALADICDDYCEVGVARLGAQIRYFRRRGVRLATMAGKIHKTLLFHRFYWLKHFPDWRCVMAFYPHFITRTKDRKDDTMLLAVVDAYAHSGIRFAPATDFAPELLVKAGLLSGSPLTKSQHQDVEFGWQLAKEMGRLDVGQTVTVKGRAVLAVEAVEGTDACIRRTGELCPAGGFTMVKVAKPQQDMRFDVPTIGCGTIEQLAAAGGRVLAIEAHKTIILDEPEVVRLANRHGISIVAVEDAAATLPIDTVRAG
ncbi:MAG: UDP-2,3-diacylglucosamine diphosphatase LpxI [Pirellulaceae bacterium]|nr:UDP-2,3-diacylglucosamine diphosphatase LpxI [Planctomycetales bacterium]